MKRPLLPAMLLALVLLACRAVAPGGTPTPTPSQLTHVDWLAYHDDLARFTIQHPLTWQQQPGEGYPVVFALQDDSGTNLIEKRMEINVRPQQGGCRQATYGGGADTNLALQQNINGVDWLRENGSGIALGNLYDWVSYSTVRDPNCITVTFVLHSADPGVYATEPPTFDPSAESAIFDELFATFRFDSQP
jgi:hypothetical protein